MVYSSTGKYIINPDEKRVIDSGTYGTIYEYDKDTCFKVFKHQGIHKPDPIITLKELSLKNFYKIYDLLYDYNLEYTGYIMQYYKQEDFNILSDRDYLLDSVNGIYDGIMELTRRMIQVVDLHEANIIVNKDGMTVIDIDNFKKFNGDNTYINIFRYKEVLKVLLYRYLKYYKPKHPMAAYLLIKRLVDENSSDLTIFNDIMKGFQKPIDYFNKVL